MVKIVDVAAYVVKKYKEVTGEVIDEMKLHKLLYFIQRESFALTGAQAFAGDFEGWRFGPVSRDIRSNYFNGEILCQTNEVPDEVAYISNNIIFEYGSLASWKLSELSHKELSWRRAREGLAPGENGSRELKLSDIREDSKKIRPYDHVWDMYYDEFDDLQEEVVSP